MKATNKPLFIGALARQAGVSVDTVRYYERIGLIPRPGRTPAGYRSFEPSSIDRLFFIQKAQKLGFTLEEIKRVLDQRGTGALPCDTVISMAQTRLDAVESQLAELSSLRDTLCKHLRQWKRSSTSAACAATQFCNLIEEIDLAREKNTLPPD